MDIAVTHLSGDRFAVQVRGQDAGPTPTELFAASLAACVGFYAERFLRRHGLEPDRLRVDCHATMSTDRLPGSPPSPCGSAACPSCPPTAATPCSPWSSTAPSTTPSARRRRSRSA
jgi:OsmC-like protein